MGADFKEQHEMYLAQKREDEMQKRQFRHNWKVMFVSSLLGALLSRPVWGLLDRVISLCTQ